MRQGESTLAQMGCDLRFETRENPTRWKFSSITLREETEIEMERLADKRATWIQLEG